MYSKCVALERKTLKCFKHFFFFLICSFSPSGTPLVAQMVKHLSTMWETWVRSLGWEDSLEKEMATHSSTLALKNPMDGGAWCRLLSMGSQRVGHDWATSLHFTSPSGTHQKEITRCYSQWPCGYEWFQWTALSLNDCWVSTVILPWCQVYSKGVFPIVFVLQKLYYTFLHYSQIFTHRC